MVRARIHKALNAHRYELRTLKCLRNSAVLQGLSEPCSMVTVATSASTFCVYAALSSGATVESEECDAGSMSRTNVLLPVGAGESQDGSVGVTVGVA